MHLLAGHNPALAGVVALTRIEATLEVIAATLGEMIAMQRELLMVDVRQRDRSAGR